MSTCASLRPIIMMLLVVDVGGGDGRNALPWLQWGFKRVVVIDSTAAALSRFRARVLAENREWLEHLVLIECDARTLPLADNTADRVLAIESLYYLNEDYERGLAQCHRVMRPQARLLLADRSYEGALLTRLLYYGGVGAMLETARSREMWDGEDEARVRTRFFSTKELHAFIAAQGFRDHRGRRDFRLFTTTEFLVQIGQAGAGKRSTTRRSASTLD